MSWLFLDWFVPLYLLVSVLVLAGFGACLYFLEPGLQDAHKWSNKTVRHHPLVASVNCRDDDSNALIWSGGQGQAGGQSVHGCCQDTGDGSQHLKDGDRKWKNMMRTIEKRPHPSFQLFPDTLHTWSFCWRDQGKVTLTGFEEFLKWNAQGREDYVDGDWGPWCPLEMYCLKWLKYNVNFMPSYTCANFYMHFCNSTTTSHTVYHEVYLCFAFN